METINRLEKEPYLGKPLKGQLKGRYRLNVRRDYRVGYRIEEEQQLVTCRKTSNSPNIPRLG